MNQQEILERVKKVTGLVLKIDPSQIGNDSNFIFDLGADSKQSVQLVGAFEEEFNISMDEDKALGVQDVQSAAAFIAHYLD